MARRPLDNPRVQGARARLVEQLRLPIRALFRQIARAVRWVMAPTEAEDAAEAARMRKWVEDWIHNQRRSW